MRMFRSDRVAALMDRMNIPDDVPVENKVVSRAIRSAQTQVEQQNFEIRKDVLKYDDVLNRQRKVVYGERHEVLEGADLHIQVRGMLEEVIDAYVKAATADGYPEEWDLEKLWKAFRQLYPISVTIEQVIDEVGGEKANLTADHLTEAMQDDASAAYDRREAELTPEIMRDVERRVVLSVLDRRWREHLYEMDYLREGIGLRAMAQRDPLVEYQREGFDMFNEMMEGIKEESVTALFNLQIEVQQNPIVEEAQDGVIPGMLFGAQASAQPGRQQPQPQSAAGPATVAKPRRPRPTPPPAVPEPTAPVPAAFAGGGAGVKPGTARPAQAGPAQPEAAAGAAGAGRNAKRGKHAADGRGHATAAGRGQAATHSSSEEQQDGPVMPPGFEPHRPRQLQYSAPSDSGGVEVKRDSDADPYASVGRNDPCPCGSGRKFKRCHGDRSTQ
jgi:preprotein translocase subunit SecA